MAHYLITATPKQEKLDELRKQLQQDAFLGLQPFGYALTMGLRNARLQQDSKATWEEEDYCSPPLAEEREAVLDHYFEKIQVQKVEAGKGWTKIEHLPYLFAGLDEEE